MPIFNGGGTSSRVRESQYRWIAAKERLERTSRDTERQARDAYLGVNTEIARVQALKQAVESTQTALNAAEAGYEVGTRTTVDVLAARQKPHPGAGQLFVQQVRVPEQLDPAGVRRRRPGSLDDRGDQPLADD